MVSVNCFLRDTYERKLTLEEADNQQSKLVIELKGIDKDVKPVAKRYFSEQLRIIS